MSKDDLDLQESPVALSRSQVRRVDQIAIEEFEVPGLVLMENAGRGCFEQLQRRNCQGPVVVCSGPGNNGGDGFVIARFLDIEGIDVKILLLGDRKSYSGDALTNLRIIEKMKLEMVYWSEIPARDTADQVNNVKGNPAEWIVDSLLGTGATGPLRPPMDSVVRFINASAANRMAIDVPTGMDCDTGCCQDPTVLADVTCTFVATKPGFASESGRQHCGEIHVVDIGAPTAAIERAKLAR